ncbi:glycosyltransferase [Planococcus beigongshangi]|uniref:glycosyltransferase n=1 Tax=Planococcus beigongshangi TaxID=2782536 RepID=UPI00193C4666|nr:glycosyltransferase [Planococcus beigongshangi]
MKRIVVASNMFPSEKHPTYGIFVHNQVELLRRNGVDVAVIANANPDKGKANLLRKYASWFMDYMKYVSANRKSISAVHAHYIFPSGVLAMLSKKIWNIPYAVTAHGGDLDQMPNKSPLIRKLTASIMKNADEFIVVGEALKDNALSLQPVPEDKLHVISMGVDTEIFKPLPAPETAGLIPSAGPAILYVGNIIRAKGLLELADAFKAVQAQTPEAALYLIGSRKDTGFTEELTQKIGELGLNNVRFIDPQPQAEINRWMNAADVLVLPSHIEGFGLVALEAMAAGLPVVGSEVGGLKFLLAEKRGVLFQKGDSEGLAAGIQSVLTDKEMHLDEEKIQEAVQEHSFSTIVAKLLRLYKGMGSSND